MVIADGSIMIHQMHENATPCLVRVEHTDIPDRYWVHYLDDPESGRSHGSSGTWKPDTLRNPVTLEEHLWMQTYLVNERVRRLKEELAEAEKDAEAVKRYARITSA